MSHGSGGAARSEVEGRNLGCVAVPIVRFALGACKQAIAKGLVCHLFGSPWSFSPSTMSQELEVSLQVWHTPCSLVGSRLATGDRCGRAPEDKGIRDRSRRHVGALGGF